jgi:hypothetical protein
VYLLTRHRFDPLVVPPEEIWVAIIAECSSESRLGTEVVISQDTLLDLMQVSRLWNIRISSSATLWVDIILEDEDDAAAKAYLALHYSKHASLALYMHYPTAWWDTLQEYIIANRTRITKLFIHNLNNSVFEHPILRRLSPLSSLASFNYYPNSYQTWDDNLDYLLDSPIVRTNLVLDRGILERRTAWDLRGVRLRCELEDVFDLLEGSEHLQDVIVDPETLNEEPGLNVKASLPQSPQLPWRSLSYDSGMDSFLVAIIPRLSELVVLNVHVSQKLFCHLMPLLFQLESLSVFDVIMRGKWDRLERLVITQASTRVQTAALYIQSNIFLVTEPVVEALFRSLPNIQHLTIQCHDFLTIRMLTSINGFQHLETLSLNAILRERSISDGVLEPFAASVKRVTYWMDGTLSNQLIPLQSHHIEHLEICSSTLSELDMYSQGWMALHTMEFNYNITVNWKGLTYRHLHSICLLTFPGGHMSQGGRNGTKVCRDIALHPEYFPALSKLELGACPELDILFILLETRNVVTPPGISPISALVIPTCCPPSLVERLRDLIKGINRGTSRYYDLSIAGNYDIITDASM